MTELNINFKLFQDIKKTLDSDDYYIGEVNNQQFNITRYYITNINDIYVRLYYSKIKYHGNIQPIAKICFVHGFGHHSFDFIDLALFLSQRGMICHMIDLRGHGLSGGTKMNWNIYDFHSDIITLIKQSEKDNFDLPLYIFGHSMGGGLVSSLFINNPYLQVNGIILSSPLLGFPVNVENNFLKNYFIRNFGSSLKDLMINGNINPTSLTKDDSEIPKMIMDKRSIPICTPYSFKHLMKMFTRIIENSRYFNVPCLILHGDADKYCNVNHSKTFYDNIRSKEKDILIFSNGYHELYKDTCKNQFFEKCYSWITKTISKGKTDKRKLYLFLFLKSFPY